MPAPRILRGRGPTILRSRAEWEKYLGTFLNYLRFRPALEGLDAVVLHLLFCSVQQMWKFNTALANGLKSNPKTKDYDTMWAIHDPDQPCSILLYITRDKETGKLFEEGLREFLNEEITPRAAEASRCSSAPSWPSSSP
jgi:hypothetical protein